MKKDVSTLKDLTPSFGHQPSFRRFKNSSFYHGSHLLNQRKPTRLPAASRKYIRGDPIKAIDWRAYARTDQLLIREKRDEATSLIGVYVDARDTMLWPDAGVDHRNQVTKLEIAARVALNLSYSHTKVGDQVKLIFIDESNKFPVISVRSATDVLEYFHGWDRRNFSLGTLLGDANPSDKLKKWDVCYIISDFINLIDLPQFFAATRLLNCLQTLHSKEVNVSWVSDEFCYFDEMIDKREYLGSTLKNKQGYGLELRDWVKSLKTEIEENRGNYLQVTDQTSIEFYADSLKSLT